MKKNENLIWANTRLGYYRECLTRFAMDSNESRYLRERIAEFERHVGDIIQDRSPVS